jgi:hypothetical protein
MKKVINEFLDFKEKNGIVLAIIGVLFTVALIAIMYGTILLALSALLMFFYNASVVIVFGLPALTLIDSVCLVGLMYIIGLIVKFIRS